MAEMLVQSKSLTNIADKIRVLSGTTEQMGLDDMATNVGEANSDVATEADLIAQISTALEGKASGNESDIPLITITTQEVYDNMHYLDMNMQHQTIGRYATAQTFGGIIWFESSNTYMYSLECSVDYTQLIDRAPILMARIHADATIEYW